MRRAVLLAVALLALLPAVASAHAQLQTTAPVRGALLSEQPRAVTFAFDEAVTATAGSVRVYDATGVRVDDGAAAHPDGRGTVVAVGLRMGLPQGTYTATYRVVSADSHVVTGGFSFAVGARGTRGETVADLLAGQRTGRVTAAAFTAAKVVQYAAIGVGAGVVLFLLLVWPPAPGPLAADAAAWAAASRRFAGRLRAILVPAATAGAVSAGAAVVLQAARSGGVDAWTAVDRTVVGDVLHSRFGALWTAAAVVWMLVAVAAALLLARPDARHRRAVLVLPLAALLALPGVSGHAGVQDPVALSLPANVVHVAAMAVWVGGLVALLGALPAATRALEGPDRTRVLGAVLGRFSALALASVVVLLATGIVQSLLQVDAWSQLPDTGFGRSILVKVALLTGLVALGVVNRRRSLPRLRTLEADGAAPGETGVLLRRTLRAEVVLLAVVLVVSGILSGSTPAKDVATGPVQLTGTIGPAQLTLDVDPARPGANEIHVYLFDRRSGAPFRRAKEVTVTATLPDKGIGPLPLRTQVTGPGHWTIASAVLAVPGSWRLDVTSRVSDFDEYEREVTVRIR